MPLARERSRIEAPSYPFSQKTSVAWARISASRLSKRVAGAGAARCRRTETLVAVDGLPIDAKAGANSNVRSTTVYGNCDPDHKPGFFPGSTLLLAFPSRLVRLADPSQSIAHIGRGGQLKSEPAGLLHFGCAHSGILSQPS